MARTNGRGSRLELDSDDLADEGEGMCVFVVFSKDDELLRLPSGQVVELQRRLAQHWESIRTSMGDALEHLRPASVEAMAHLLSTAEIGKRVSEASQRIGVTSEAMVAALDEVATRTPAGANTPQGTFSEADEAVLREAGSFEDSMPPLEERASFHTQLLRQQIVAGALTVKDAASHLGVSEGRIRQRLGARTLLGIERDGWRLPDFQFTADGDLPGLAEVLPAFPDDVHPAAVLLFLNAPSSELEVDGVSVTPRAWLETGGPPRRVAELVEDAYVLS